MARTNLELLTDPPPSRHVEEPSSKSRFGPILLNAVAVGLAVAWGFLASTSYTRGLDRLDEFQLDRAQSVWTASTEQALSALQSEARVLVDDSRVREPLAIPNIDDGTLLDLLEELKTASDASLVGLVDERGVVRVVAGADPMRGVDLSKSTLMKPGDNGPSAATWVFPDRIVAVVVAPVRLGERFVAHLMLGRDIGPTTLSMIDKGTGSEAAVVFQQKLVAATTADPARSVAMVDAAALETGKSARIGADLLARTVRIDANKGGRVVFAVPHHQSAGAFGMGIVLWWAPAIFVLLGTLIFWGFEYRRLTPVGGN